VDECRVLQTFLEEHVDRLVIYFQDDIPFVAEMLDEFLKGLYLLLHDVG
jgi:hypothetical protein